MEYDDYKLKYDEIDNEADMKKNELDKEYAYSHNTIKVGDFITDHIGTIKVEKISYAKFNPTPECVYIGPIYTKSGHRSKCGGIRYVFQRNIKGHI